jgi:hypothetical protein
MSPAIYAVSWIFDAEDIQETVHGGENHPEDGEEAPARWS